MSAYTTPPDRESVAWSDYIIIIGRLEEEKLKVVQLGESINKLRGDHMIELSRKQVVIDRLAANLTSV